MQLLKSRYKKQLTKCNVVMCVYPPEVKRTSELPDLENVVIFQGFYQEVSRPLLLEVDLRYPDTAVDGLTNNRYSQLFKGSEIVVAGQLENNIMDNFVVEVFAHGVRNEDQSINQSIFLYIAP